MNKALLCAGALLLTGCGRETDLSKRYADYFNDSFGDDAKFTYQKNDDGDEDDDCYLLEFTDSTGYPVSYQTWFTPFAKNSAKVGEPSAQLIRDYGILGNAVNYEARKAQWTQTHDTEHPFLTDLREELIRSYD